MAIEWYPGHMVTAKKEAALAMRKTDVVIEVLDARVPGSSRNPMIEQLRRENQRAALKILNKSDTADPERTKLWLAHYNGQPGVKAVALSAKLPKEVKRIPAYAQALAPHRNSAIKPLRMMILGIPNVGKSTLMNTLLSRAVTKVGDEPAVTKIHQRHELGTGMWLTDTPGMLWPGIDPDTALKLAATHSIGRNAYDNTEVAACLGGYLLEWYRPLLEARYGEIPSGIGGYALVDVVAFARGFLIKGGAPDRERASRILLGEFRDGKLGKISLEVPNEPVWEDSDPAGSASIESDRIESELGEPELGEPELGEPELGGPDPD
jgi:ribosome biogenesis GTPase A